MPTVTFGSRAAANEVRDLPAVRDHLTPADDRRATTVRLQAGTPDSVLSRLQTSAADSRRGEAAKTGQTGLSRVERSRIDFSRRGVNVPKMRSIKAIAQAEGVEDWLSFADLTLTVDENRQILREASREERGRRGLGRSAEADRTMGLARGVGAQRAAIPGAKEAALLERDREAQDFLREEQGFGTDVFDISFRGSRPSGRDFELLEDVHESRSPMAQRVDEALMAPRTRDPIEWANAPDELDFPGIDTVAKNGASSGVPEPADPLDIPPAKEMGGSSGGPRLPSMDMGDDQT